MRCAHCFKPIRQGGPDVLVVQMRGWRGETIELRWHLPDTSIPGLVQSACAETDDLHMALADALNQPDGHDSDRATEVAYMAIRDRAAAEGVDVLRGVVHVRTDIPGPKTLRGPGLTWGRLAPRAPQRRMRR